MASKKKKIPDGLKDLTEKQAETLRGEITTRRTALKKKDIAAENRRAAEVAQRETDDEAIQAAYKRLGIQPNES